MKKGMIFTLAFCLLFSVTVNADTVKIGLMGPLTGAWASEGQEMKKVDWVRGVSFTP